MIKNYLYAIVSTMCILSYLQTNAFTDDIIARHYTDTPIYANNTRITLSTSLTFNYSDIASLALEIRIPENWKFISFSDPNLPVENNNGIISTYWYHIPDSVHIQYDLEIHENDKNIQTIAALVKYRRHGIDTPLYADVLPDPLQLASSGYYITATAGSGGQILPSGSLLIAATESQAFSIQSDIGYTINTLSVDNKPVSLTSYYVFNSVSDNHIIDVSFKKMNYQLTIETTDGGTATPSGELNLAYGTMQQITITPDMGYVTDMVLINGESVSFTNNELQVLVSSDMNIEIAFRKNQLMPTHYCESTTYAPQTPLEIQARIENPYELDISALSMRVSIPFQWSIISTNGDKPPDKFKMTDNNIDFTWISKVTDDVIFSYTLQPPDYAAGEKTISAEILYRISDHAEQSTPVSADIHLNRIIIPDTRTIQGIVYLGGNPAPYTAQVNVSLLYMTMNDTPVIIETKSDGPDYMLGFIDPGVEIYTVLASYSGYKDCSTRFSQIPEDSIDLYLSMITNGSIKITEIQESDSSATLVYEKELSTVQIGNTAYISGQQLQVQTKNHQHLATIDIETGVLRQITSSPSIISYTLREGIISTSSYVSKSNGNLFEMSIKNADIAPQKGIILTIPIQSNLSISDFQGNNPTYAVFYAPNKMDLFEGRNIVSIPPEDLIEINDQGISFMARAQSIFSVGEIISQGNDDNKTIASDDSGGGCFIEILMNN